jgi:small subunit ribosomal protein S7
MVIPIVNKLINTITRKGKKTKAYNIILKTLINIRVITGKSSLFVILKSFKNLKSYVELIKIRKAGKVYDVPVPLKKKKQLFLIINSILLTVNNSKVNGFEKSLTLELLSLFFKKSISLKSKDNLSKKIYLNRAVTHYRWR